MASVTENTSLGGYVTKYEHVNFSPAKHTFSFGKEKRFPTPQKLATNTLCYEMKSSFQKRACGFGIGERF